MITDAEIDAVLARLGASDFAVFSLVMFTAWGRRPKLTVEPGSAVGTFAPWRHRPLKGDSYWG